jgi:hypothetical protein
VGAGAGECAEVYVVRGWVCVEVLRGAGGVSGGPFDRLSCEPVLTTLQQHAERGSLLRIYQFWAFLALPVGLRRLLSRLMLTVPREPALVFFLLQ